MSGNKLPTANNENEQYLNWFNHIRLQQKPIRHMPNLTSKRGTIIYGKFEIGKKVNNRYFRLFIKNDHSTNNYLFIWFTL